MSWWSSWSLLQILLFIHLKCATLEAMLPMDESVFPRVVVAASHTALSGDLAVLILGLPPTETTTLPTTTVEDVDIVMEEEEESARDGSSTDPLVLRVLRLDGFASELVGEVPVEPVPYPGGNISLTVPCGFLSRGGTYSLQLQRKNSPVPAKLTDIVDAHEVQMKTTLDVRWPTPSLSLEPQHFETYPGQPVIATLEYTGISCTPSTGVPIAAYSLQLIYCGASVLSCDTRNKSHVQALHSDEINGFPTQKVLTLRCELFGQSGHYALRLKPTAANPSAPTTSAYIKVEWSHRFVFNVRARSVYPCDGSSGGGVSVLFEYPSCRLQGDLVRVYGRLRADVASLAPPSTLHYLAELKAPPGRHTLTFDCDIFTERFVEYCFVYVSQAITGAMSEVRVDCIPTFPLAEGHAGGWGLWSQWTPCSSSCVGGTRHRYRFCDKPAPRYGAKFCQGQAVETEGCGGSDQLDLGTPWTPGEWECRHGKDLAADKPEVAAEVGRQCRCGCLVKLEENKTRRILAASTQACPGRSFWLVQTEPDQRVKLHLDQAKFPCKDQYVRVRDGDSLSAELLADVAFDRNAPSSGTVVSSETRLLVEFFSDEEAAVHSSCVGGFLAHATTFPKTFVENGTTIPTAFLNPKIMAVAGRWALWLTPAHLAAATLLVLIFLGSLFLALQYALKYRKYEIAEDLDSLTDNSACSGSMQGLARRARAMSSATLISEVVSLVRLPRRGSTRHVSLEETPADLEDGYESTGTQVEGEEDRGSVGSVTLKQKESDEGSCATITPAGAGTPVRGSSSASSTSAPGQPEVKYARPVKLRTAGPISPVSEEPSTSECSGRYSVTSASISLNNVRVPHPKPSTLLRVKGFSPASTSSNLSTLRCGKESKDRRNRERLLQGPGSEFSLANQDMDLELDYYDYNVVNAGAAPGSYLGMDPAFLVWIPPLDPGESDILASVEEDHHYEEIPGESRSSPEDPQVVRKSETDARIKLDTEGAALTPAEYKLIRDSKLDKGEPSTTALTSEGTSSRRRNDLVTRRLDPGESRLHDEIITEYRARLSEGILPVHRILEESRVHVSDESLARYVEEDPDHRDLIPNRLVEEGDESEVRFAPKANRTRLSDEQERSRSTRSAKSGQRNSGETKKANGRFSDDFDGKAPSSLGGGKTRVSEEIVRNRAFNDNEIPPKTPSLAKRRNNDGFKSRRNSAKNRDKDNLNFIVAKENAAGVHRGSKDAARVTDLNVVRESSVAHAVNIPLHEFPRGKIDSPVRVHRPKENRKETSMEKEIQSPDYGVEADMKDDQKGFYDLIGEGEDGFKFADEEDDYVDNKVTA